MTRTVSLEDRLSYVKSHFSRNPSRKVMGKLLQILYPNLDKLYGRRSDDMSVDELKDRTFIGIAKKLKENNYGGCFTNIPLTKLSDGVRYSICGFQSNVRDKFNYSGLLSYDEFNDVEISKGMIFSENIHSKENRRKAHIANGQILIEDTESEQILELVAQGKSAREVAQIVTDMFGNNRNFKTIRRHYEIRTGESYPNLEQVNWRKEIEFNDSKLSFIEYVDSLYMRVSNLNKGNSIYEDVCKRLNQRRERFGYGLITFKKDMVRNALKKYWDEQGISNSENKKLVA